MSQIFIETLNIFSIVIGIAGILIGIIVARHYFNKSQKMLTRSKKMDWDEVLNAINDIIKQLKCIDEEKRFIPDVIFVPNIKSTIIASYLTNYFDTYIPTLLGLSIFKKRYPPKVKENILSSDSYIYFETAKWYVYLPMNLFDYNKKKVLIVDDFVMSGEYLSSLKELLVNNGFDKKNIKTMCLAITEVAIGSKKGPDYYWKVVNPGALYFPWGKPE